MSELQTTEKATTKWWAQILALPFLWLFIVGMLIGFVFEPIRQGMRASREIIDRHGWGWPP